MKYFEVNYYEISSTCWFTAETLEEAEESAKEEFDDKVKFTIKEITREEYAKIVGPMLSKVIKKK